MKTVGFSIFILAFLSLVLFNLALCSSNNNEEQESNSEEKTGENEEVSYFIPRQRRRFGQVAECINFPDVDYVSRSLSFQIDFDGSDQFLKDFMLREASSLYFIDQQKYYGFYSEPETNNNHFFNLPLSIFLTIPDSDDENEDEVDGEAQNLTSGTQTPPHTSSGVTSKSFVTPPSLKKTGIAYNNRNLRRKFNCRCTYAFDRFKKRMLLIPGEPQIHTGFDAQEIIFTSDLINEFNLSIRLDAEHLRAFELAFDVFFRLVARCPKKFILQALALSLQYDDDFPKFLELFYKIEIFNRQQKILRLILLLPVISQRAFDFFTDSKNAAFFFSDLDSFPNYAGKFSPNVLATELVFYRSSNKTSQIAEYPQNRLRSLILNFNYPECLESFSYNSKISTAQLDIIDKTISLFPSENDFLFALYNLVKNTKDENFMSKLLNLGRARKVLIQALSLHDFDTVKFLFLHLTLELKNVTLRSAEFNSGKTDVIISHLGTDTCQVQLKNSEKDLTLILPLKHSIS